MDQENQKKSKFSPRIAGVMVAVVTSLVILTQLGAAVSVNWTEIIDLLNGVATIFPSITSVITAAVPVLLIVTVVGFVIGLFDSILGGITGVLGKFGR